MSGGPVIVRLPPEELARALDVARRRQAENIEKQRQARYGAPESPEAALALHIKGTPGEAVVAYWRGIPWDGNLGNLDAADVGARVQARTTDHRDGRLILHPPPDPPFRPRGDKPGDAFVHVRSLGFSYFELVGWIWGYEGQKPEYWCDPTGQGRPAFFVDNEIMRSIHTLPLYPRF